MKLLPSLLLDQIGYAPSRPQRSAIAQHFGTLFQTLAQLLQLSGVQARLTARPRGLDQRLGSLLSPRLMPTADRLAMDAQAPCHLALAQPSVEKPGGFEPPSFQLYKITLDAFWISHAQRLSRNSRSVTILCEYQ